LYAWSGMTKDSDIWLVGDVCLVGSDQGLGNIWLVGDVCLVGSDQGLGNIWLVGSHQDP